MEPTMAMSTLGNLYTIDEGRSHRTVYSELINMNFVPECASEVIIRNIPQDTIDYELFSFLERVGTLFRLRIMMSEDGARNRGFGYAIYASAAAARRAVEDLNCVPYKSSYLKIAISTNECRLFIGGIPPDKDKDDIWTELINSGIHNIVNVLTYKSMFETSENRGYVFVEFRTRQEAIECRMAFHQNLRLWDEPVVVDWPLRAHHAEKFKLKPLPLPPVTNCFGHTDFSGKMVYTMAPSRSADATTSFWFENILSTYGTRPFEGNPFPHVAYFGAGAYIPQVVMQPEDTSNSFNFQVYEGMPMYYYPLEPIVFHPPQLQVESPPIVNYQNRTAAIYRGINESPEDNTSNQGTEPTVRFRPY